MHRILPFLFLLLGINALQVVIRTIFPDKRKALIQLQKRYIKPYHARDGHNGSFIARKTRPIIFFK